MHSTEQALLHYEPLIRATRRRRSARFLRVPIAVAALVVVVSACGPFATQRITGTSTDGDHSSLWSRDGHNYTTGALCNGEFGGCGTDYSVGLAADGRFSPNADLQVTYVGHNEGVGLQFISLWSWRTWSWVPIDAFRVVGAQDTVIHAPIPEPNTDWQTDEGVGFVRVTTVGNFTHNVTDYLMVCGAGSC